MKTLIHTFSLATTFALALNAGPLRAQDAAVGPPPGTAPTAAPAPGDSGVPFQTFYDQLANQGAWVQTDQYGYVFQPTETNPNWAPYTYGHWVNTDAGMTWVSDDSFGWATDHYGRWVNLANYGWVWVPGSTWAPAWVSWRQSDDGQDVGWAPLPPDSDVGIDYDADAGYDVGFGFHIGDDCDVAYGIGPWCYNFCPVAYIGDSDCWHHFRHRGDNFGYIRHTRNITNINFNRDGAGRFGRVHAEGPSVAALNARAHTQIRTVRLASATSRNGAGLRGNTLAVYAPRVDGRTIAGARPASVSRHLGKVTVNRGTDISHPLAVNAQLRPTGATTAQVHAATEARGRYASSARIATTDTPITRALKQPLTSTRTNERSVATQSQVNSRTSASAESRSTGESERATSSSGEDRRFTGGGAATATHTAPAVQHAPAYAGGEAYHPVTAYHSATPVYHPQANASVYHAGTPTYHSAASAPAFRSSASTYHPPYHPSAPAYHPQASFHAAAPHFSGGGGGGPHASAPAAHGGGGGHASGGGGAHASAGKH